MAHSEPYVGEGDIGASIKLGIISGLILGAILFGPALWL